MFSKVLIPLDGSERAQLILTYLKPLLLRADARVVLFQAAQYPATPGTVAYVPTVDFEPAARHYIDQATAALGAEGVHARGLVRVGPAAACILDAIDDEGASMVALATHGRTGVARWTLGSVAEKVIRSCPVPVLAFRSFPSERSLSANLVPPQALAPERILVPLDGSENSLGVTPFAIALARLFDSRVSLLRVHEAGEHGETPRRGPPGMQAGPAPAFGAVTVERALRQFADAGVAAELVETSGDPGTQILRTAHQSGAKLIAIATHGRSGPTRWMLGSVTEKVLRASEVPLLIVRSPQLKSR